MKVRPLNDRVLIKRVAEQDTTAGGLIIPDSAKEKQAHIAGRIAMLDDRIARAQVIDPSGQDPDKVRFGATVVLTDVETDDEVTYMIVGEDEADAREGRISVTSPVARALMSKEVGDEVVVKVPKGTRELEILEIRFDG